MPHVYVHDLATGSTSILSVSSTGVQGDGESFPGSISPDGRYVSFDSFATNLVPGDTNWAEDVFVADRVTGTLERVSLSSSGQPANFDCDWSSVSADGRYVAFNSYATNLVTGDNNGTWDVFVRDRQLATTTLVNVNQAGSVPRGGCVPHFDLGRRPLRRLRQFGSPTSCRGTRTTVAMCSCGTSCSGPRAWSASTAPTRRRVWEAAGPA
jgi:Tol biopolymer transport system component